VRVATLPIAFTIAVVSCRPTPEPVYGAGRPATMAEIANVDIDVNAAGVGLPAGEGSADQGAALYAALCAGCHGSHGEGTPAGAQLVRPVTITTRRNIASHWPYAPPLFDYIRRAMPPDRPGSYGADTLYAIVAHLLRANRIDIPNGIANAGTLPRVQMPARSLFVPDDRRGGREVR
jgi:hypothetical protein